MAKIDLASPEWCELVFTERNKGYGAYQIRQESSKRYNWAMAVVLVVALLVFALPHIRLSQPVQKEVVTEVTVFSALEEAEVKDETIVRCVEPLAPPPALKSTIKFTAPVIKKDEEVREEDEMKSQEEVTHTELAISIADVKGNDEVNGQDIADLKEVVTQVAPVDRSVLRQGGGARN